MIKETSQEAAVQRKEQEKKKKKQKLGLLPGFLFSSSPLSSPHSLS